MKITKAMQVKAEKASTAEGPGVKKYSRYKMYQKLTDAGIWESVKEAMTEAGLIDAIYMSNEFSSEDVLFSSAVPMMRAKFPDVDVDSMLSECEI